MGICSKEGMTTVVLYDQLVKLLVACQKGRITPMAHGRLMGTVKQ